jgi:hypothetical protein
MTQGNMLSLLTINEDPLTVLLTTTFDGYPPAELQRLVVLRQHWVIGLKWMAKLKWGKTPEDFSPRRKFEKLMRPFGERLYRLIELCYQLHPTSEGAGYENAIHWFRCIFNELLWADKRRCLEGDPEVRGKWALRVAMSEQGKALRDGINPIDRQDQPHIWALYESGLWESANTPAFNKRYWLPYLGACAAHAKSLEATDFKAGNCKDGVQGRGRPKVCKKRRSKALP